MPRKRKNTGFHLPDYEYCGPGTVNRGGRPINRIDRACKRHDEDPDFDYLRFNDADQRLIEDVERYSKDDPIAASTISNIFKAKKFVTPYKKSNKLRKLNSAPDLPSNSLDNVTGEPSEVSDSNMRARKNGGKGYGGKRSARRKSNRKNGVSKNSKRRRKSSKFRKGTSKSIAKTIAQVMNPSRQYESENGYTWTMPTADSTFDRVNYLIDPHYVIYNNRNSWAPKSHQGFSVMSTIYQTLFGHYLNTAGSSAWMLGGYEKFRLSNFSNSDMQLRIYTLTSVSKHSKLPIESCLDGTGLGNPPYTSNSSLFIMSEQDFWAGITKTFSIHDFKYLKTFWKITRTHSVKLGSNENHTIILKQPARLIKYDHYNGNEYVPGSQRFLIEIITNLTADADTTMGTTSRAKGYAFTAQSLVIEQMTSQRWASKIDRQRINYLDRPIDDNDNAGVTPLVVGEPVNSTGAAVNDVN